MSELSELTGFDDLDTLLKKAECELQLGGKEDLALRRVRDFISSSSLYSAQEVRGMAYNQQESQYYVRALILYRISVDLQDLRSLPPDDKAKWITGHVIDIKCAAYPLIKAEGTSRSIAVKYGLEYMEKLFHMSQTRCTGTLFGCFRIRCF